MSGVAPCSRDGSTCSRNDPASDLLDGRYLKYLRHQFQAHPGTIGRYLRVSRYLVKVGLERETGGD